MLSDSDICLLNKIGQNPNYILFVNAGENVEMGVSMDDIFHSKYAHDNRIMATEIPVIYIEHREYEEEDGEEDPDEIRFLLTYDLGIVDDMGYGFGEIICNNKFSMKDFHVAKRINKFFINHQELLQIMNKDTPEI